MNTQCVTGYTPAQEGRERDARVIADVVLIIFGTRYWQYTVYFKFHARFRNGGWRERERDLQSLVGTKDEAKVLAQQFARTRWFQPSWKPLSCQGPANSLLHSGPHAKSELCVSRGFRTNGHTHCFVACMLRAVHRRAKALALWLGFCGQFDFVYVPVDFGHCASDGFAFVNFLNSDQADQFRTCFLQYAQTCMPGYQRCLAEDNMKPCDGRCCSCAVEASTVECHRISSTSEEFDSPDSATSAYHIQNSVVRGTWLVERRTRISRVLLSDLWGSPTHLF